MNIASFLGGSVHLSVESAFPERILNLCAANQIAFWDVLWKSPTIIELCVSRGDLRHLRRASKKMECTITVMDRKGLVYFLAKFRRRYVLAAGLAVTICLLFVSSFFIWDFDVQGNVSVSDETILRALAKEGVTFGTYGFSIDPQDLKNRVLLDVPELSYLTVNVYGCRAHIIVRERVIPPRVVDRTVPTNVVATKDGLVTRVQVYGGNADVMKDSTVTKGQLLISGIVDIDLRGVHITHGEGKVYARTWYDLTAKMPATTEAKSYTGKKNTKTSVIWGAKRIKLYISGSISYDNYDKITTRTKICLPGGIALPAAIVRETYREYTPTPLTPDDELLALRVKSALEEQLNTRMDYTGEIINSNFSYAVKDGIVTALLSAECEEQIGKTVEIPPD